VADPAAQALAALAVFAPSRLPTPAPAPAPGNAVPDESVLPTKNPFQGNRHRAGGQQWVAPESANAQRRRAIAWIAWMAAAATGVSFLSNSAQLYGLAMFTLLLFRAISAAGNRPLPPKDQVVANPDVAAVIPAFNEDVKLVARCIDTLLAQTLRPRMIVIVDDGSTEVDLRASLRPYHDVAARQGVHLVVHRFAVNRGKRHALAHGVHIARSVMPIDVYLTVDSDTVLDRNAVRHLMAPFSDPTVMAATGLVVALNRSSNLLTRLIDVRYTAAFELERGSQSAFGAMLCCCGSLAAYRASLVEGNLDDFLNQEFLGRPATFGDDRRLTAYAVRDGRAVYVRAARAWTAVPERFGHFLRQQARWSRSWTRETWLLVRHGSKRQPAWWITTLEALGVLAFSTALLFSMVRSAANPHLGALATYAAVILLISLTRAIPYGSRKDLTWRERIAGILVTPIYATLHLTVILPVRIFAMCTLKRNNWGTREQGVEVTGG
jgi:hyaluronan synthase